MTSQRRNWPGPSISADAENGPWQTTTVIIITIYFIEWLLRVKCSSYSICHKNPPRYVNYLHFRENWSYIQRNFHEFLKVTSRWYKPLLDQAYKTSQVILYPLPPFSRLDSTSKFTLAALHRTCSNEHRNGVIAVGLLQNVNSNPQLSTWRWTHRYRGLCSLFQK